MNLQGLLLLKHWIFPTAENNYGRYIISKQGSLSGSGYSLVWGNAQNEPKIVLRINDEELDSKSLIPENQWTHIAATITPTGKAEIFINGTLDADSTINFPENNNDSLFIGTAGFNGHYANFIGYIDAVVISNFSKSEAELKSSIYTIVDIQDYPSHPLTTESYNFDMNNLGSVEGMICISEVALNIPIQWRITLLFLQYLDIIQPTFLMHILLDSARNKFLSLILRVTL